MARSTQLVTGHGSIDSASDPDQEYIYFMGSDMARSTRLVILSKNIYTLWGLKLRIYILYRVGNVEYIYFMGSETRILYGVGKASFYRRILYTRLL